MKVLKYANTTSIPTPAEDWEVADVDSPAESIARIIALIDAATQGGLVSADGTAVTKTPNVGDITKIDVGQYQIELDQVDGAYAVAVTPLDAGGGEDYTATWNFITGPTNGIVVFTRLDNAAHDAAFSFIVRSGLA